MFSGDGHFRCFGLNKISYGDAGHLCLFPLMDTLEALALSNTFNDVTGQ